MVQLNSVEKILAQLEQQPGWAKFKEYRQLIEAWAQIVDHKNAQHTKVMYIRQKVLWVAVSSAVRSQELTFQRRSLLRRLNRHSSFDLKDIRFSTAAWHESSTSSHQEAAPVFKISKRHKRKDSKNNNQPSKSRQDISSAAKAQEALQSLLDKMTAQRSSKSLIACPKCSSLTPKAELDKWNYCYLCVAKKYSTGRCFPNFPN